jgi:phospholipid/cholesterol/gamma-HCH transport system substrate-binding protein
MEPKREQVFVGLFVIVATVLLVATVFALTGAFQPAAKILHAKFNNAAGLEPGASVRYAGGDKVGRVEKLQIDPTDPTRIDMSFSVQKDVPVKTDSHVTILSFSPLGDNHLEIKAGSRNAPIAQSGAVLTADPYIGLSDVTAQINDMVPQAKELLGNLNNRVVELRETILRVNDLINEKNRANVAASLANLNGMLAENRPVVKSALRNVNAATEKIQPLLDQMRKTLDQANATLKNVDGVIGENRKDLRASIIKLRESLNTVSDLTQRIDQTLDVNSENIDEILENMRHVSENLKEFTDQIKNNPSSLIRSSSPKEHKPGGQP